MPSGSHDAPTSSRAEDWRWGSLHRWQRGSGKDLLAAWLLRRLANWVEEVNGAANRG